MNMNVKKTIAAVAAITMVASSTTFFTGISISADEVSVPVVASGGIEETTNDENSVTDQGSEPEPEPGNSDVAVLSGESLTLGGSATVDNATVVNGSGTASVNGNTVTVTLTPEDGQTIGGQPQKGESGATQNYYVTIPITGLTTDWVFDTEGGSGYTYDDDDNKTLNITNGNLMLWLPVRNDSCTVKLKKNDNSETMTLTVTTKISSAGSITDNPGLTLSGTASVTGSTVKNATVSTSVTGDTVTVTLTGTSADAAIEGMPQKGELGATQNYYVTIPITGLTTDWEFDSGYTYDDVDNKEFNITNGNLMLWLPVESGTCTIVLSKPGTPALTKTITVSTVVTPYTAPPVVEDPEEDPAEDVKLTGGADATTGTYTATLEITGAPDSVVIDIGGENVTFVKGEDGKYTADIDITDANLEAFKAGLTMGFVGVDNDAYTITSAEAVKKPAPETPDEPGTDVPGTDVPGTDVPGTDVPGTDVPGTDVPGTDEPGTVTPSAPIVIIPSSIFDTYYDSGTTSGSAPSASSSGSSASAVVSSPAQIKSTRRPNITINAAKTKITPDMVKAVMRNKSIKNVILSYSTDMKVVISKNDIKSYSADLNFSLSSKKFLSEKAVKNSKLLSRASKLVQVSFDGDGKLNGVDKVTLRCNVGAKLAGKKVAVYEYKNGKITRILSAKVGSKGSVNFDTKGFGQFVIAVE